MTPEEGFLTDIAENPDDDLPRLVFAEDKPTAQDEPMGRESRGDPARQILAGVGPFRQSYRPPGSENALRQTSL